MDISYVDYDFGPLSVDESLSLLITGDETKLSFGNGKEANRASKVYWEFMSDGPISDFNQHMWKIDSTIQSIDMFVDIADSMRGCIPVLFSIFEDKNKNKFYMGSFGQSYDSKVLVAGVYSRSGGVCDLVAYTRNTDMMKLIVTGDGSILKYYLDKTYVSKP